ncbi:IPTL-CTERM sorting domain-containing protein [Arhodomonas sp. AD133]|uniref:IPTL-CTERM sorting domain-containing protein n=1 Tax=Arhodomonas sp. AD133 TaxID=3415009 RepID=UPI003EBC4DDA
MFTVTNGADSGAGSLREAVTDANATAGNDEIAFASGVGLITLTSGQIDITETVTIAASPASAVTVTGNDNSRVFAVTDASATLLLRNLTLTAGLTSADGVLPSGGSTTCAAGTGEGGAVCALGDISLERVTVTDSRTTGVYARGGGVFVAGDAVVDDSAITGNRTENTWGDGGGLYVGFGSALLSNSIVTGNVIAGNYAGGAGLHVNSANVSLMNSTVAANATQGPGGVGGGVWVRGGANVFNTTISGNSTQAGDGDGAGIWISGGDLSLENSTITANQAGGSGGGVALYAGANLVSRSSILAGNAAVGGNVAITDGGSSTLDVDHSLFGDPDGEITGIDTANVFSDTPALGALADNGCDAPAGAPATASCVETHAVPGSSPALDAGSNPSGLVGDQRGAGFPRLLGAAVDIGAFEADGIATLALSPAPLDFGSVTVGRTSAPATVTVANTGTAVADLDPVAVVGPQASQYAVVRDGCSGQTVAAGETCTVDVTFTPAAADTASAQLAVTSNAATSPDYVTLAGVGSDGDSGPGSQPGAGDSSARHVPALGPLGLGLLASLMGWFGWRVGGRNR